MSITLFERDAAPSPVRPWDSIRRWQANALCRWLAASAVALLLVGLVVVAVVTGATRVERLLPNQAPGLPELQVERVTFGSGQIVVKVRNTGPTAAQISQVAVDDAFRLFDTKGGGRLERLASSELRISYPWIAGEPLHVTLLTSDGSSFDHNVAAAALTPLPGRDTVLGYALLGSFVGVIPVFAGLGLLPLMARLRRSALRFLLGITGGMLLFLAVDASAEALSAGGELPSVFQGVTLVVAAAVGTFALLTALARRTSRSAHPDAKPGAGSGGRLLSFLVAGSIGLHNLGEGLAVGSAHAQGELALGAALVAGFAVHNLTEGIGIGAATAGWRPRARDVVALGLLAGLPTVAGTLAGGFAYSALLGAVFLAVGVGAVLPVLVELSRQMRGDGETHGVAVAGAGAGYLVMYLTALVVTV